MANQHWSAAGYAANARYVADLGASTGVSAVTEARSLTPESGKRPGGPRKLPGAVASVWFLLVPFVGVVVSALWLHEPVGWDVYMGGALIVVSVVLAARG